MKVQKTEKGFDLIEHPDYLSREPLRLVEESYAVDFAEGLNGECPPAGSSFLWIGKNHHLDRAEVLELVCHLSQWLNTGDLEENHG